MSGTNLDLTLTQDDLAGGLIDTGSGTAGQDVYVYAELFDANGFVQSWTLINDGTQTDIGTVVGGGSLVQNGTVSSDLDYSLPLVSAGGTLNGGKLYIVTESGPQNDVTLSGSSTVSFPQALEDQSFINPGSATAYDFSYDSIELSLLHSGTDAANLTSVNGFALPMELSVNVNGTTSSVGYNVPGASIVSGVVANAGTAVENTFTAGGLSGDFRGLTSPTAVNLTTGTVASTTEPYAQAGWAPYVAALETIAPNVTIAGVFNGAADASLVYHNGGYYAYTLQWDGTDFWLVPLASSQIQGAIQLSPATIEENIFSQIGSVNIYEGPSTSDGLIATVGVGANDQWGAILAQFLTGFTAGYYGQEATAVNQGITQTLDLDQNSNWNPSYAFQQNTETVVSPGTGYAYDPYSEVFYKDSNSYGSPYSDLLMSQYSTGGPLLGIANSDGTDASTIDLTLFGQNETPSGYTTPTLYDYIAPIGTAYALPQVETAGINIDLNFISNSTTNSGISLDPHGTIVLEWLASDDGGVPQWDSVTISGQDSTLWETWNISGSGSVWNATAVAAQTTGNVVFNNLPTAENGVSWYRIIVGQGTDYAKTYDLYTTTGTVAVGTDVNGGTATSDTVGYFLNPYYAGQSDSQAVDGLAKVAGTDPADPTQYTNALKVNLAYSTTVTYDPNLVVENLGSTSGSTGSNGFPSVVPSAPVAVVDQSGTLSALLNTAGTVTSTDGTLQFGWAGYDTNDVSIVSGGTVSGGDIITGGTVTGYGWTGSEAVQGSFTAGEQISNIGSYTNKTNPNDDAVVVVSQGSQTLGTITTTADADGDWLTNHIHFGAGTYTLSMYDAVDANGTLTPVTSDSQALVLNVQTGANGQADNSFAIACFAQGTRIGTPDGAVAVEDLAIGDCVLTLAGTRETIRWIGQREVDCTRHPQPEQVWPVCVAAGAFGPQLPIRDLFMSPDHAIYAEGVLVPIKHLVNGHSIAQRRVAAVTYFHIELAHHDVVLAEGLPVESYLDTGDRNAFANGGGATTLHPAWGSAARDIALFLEVCGFAPLTVAGPPVERLRARLAGKDSGKAA